MKKESSENSKENLQNLKLKQIEKSKTKSNTTRELMTMNNELNTDSKFSIDLVDEEEDELNSDEYISSTMLDVETNTYIDYSTISNHNEKKVINKSNTKNLRNFVKAININNKDYLNQNRKSGKSNSSNKSKSKKNEFGTYSPINANSNKKNKFKQKIRINDANISEKNNNNINNKIYNKNNNKREIIYKKLDIKDLQNKNNKSKEKDNNKNCSLYEYNPPLINYIYESEKELKKDNSNNNYMDIIKKNNGNKNVNKNNKLEINKIGIKHIRSPTMVDNNVNKNKYINEFLQKQKYKNVNNSKFNKNYVLSPNNKKIGINSLKTINTINNTETNSSLINRLVNQMHFNNYITNNNLSNNTRTINSNKNNSKNKNKLIINGNISINKINKNINRLNQIIYSPGRKIIEKTLNKNTNSSYANKIINYNSISKEKNNKNDNKLSERLLTYDFQDNHILTRNRTFKNKKILNNKTKYLNLLLNKKKINLSQAKELLIASNRSPKLKIRMNLGKKTIPNLQNLQSIQNKNNSNYHLLNSNTSSTSYRQSQGQYKTINSNNNNKLVSKNNSKKFICLKKDKQSNNSDKYSIISQKSNNNIKINPFNYQNYNINKNYKIVKRKILSQSKSKTKYEKEIPNLNNDINLTSINIVKSNINSNLIRREKIGLKKKNKQRAKTLIEEDYIRNIIMNSINQDNHINKPFLNNNFKKENKSVSNYMSLNHFKFNTDSNYLPSENDIFIKSPSERNNINFNININMNNNNYKKLVYHYHGHNKSAAFNYSYANANNNTIGKINKKDKKDFNKHKINKKKLNIL